MGDAPLKLRRPATLDHLRSKPRPERIVEIHLDPDAVRDLEQLEKSPTQDAKAKAALAKARHAVDETTVELLLRAIGRKRYDELLLAHPATDEQDAESQELLNRPAPYNTDTFPVALISASLAEPRLTEAEVSEIFDEWTSGEIVKLWTTALEVNNRSELVDLGKASRGTRG